MTAIPSVLSTICLLGVIFYISGVMATNLFGPAYPEWFGDLWRSLFSLFQIMTLESWASDIARPIMETTPHAWAFFVPFILIASFTALNLFIATGGQTYAAGEIEAWMRDAGLTKTEHRRLLRTPGFGLVSGHKPA